MCEWAMILLISPCLQVTTALAQDMDYKSIAASYSKENSVVTQNNMKLTLYWEDGKLAAKADILQERLLISDLSSNMYNVEKIYHSYFNKLDGFDAESVVPGKRGYETLKASQFKTTESRGENVFYDDSKETEISFDGLVKNSLTRVRYTLKYQDLHLLPIFYFQDNVPIISSTVEITVPKNVKMKFVLRNNQESYKITKTENETRRTITYTWKAENTPKVSYYSDAPNITYYIPQLIPFIASYESPDNGKPVQFLENEKDLYHYFYKFVKDVNKDSDEQFDKIAAEIIKPGASKRENAQNIYQWVQKNIHYVAFEDKLGGFVPRDAKDICKKKYGDCKDMASLIVALCRRAGIDAYYTWVGTRRKPYTFEETPLPTVCNHMICTIKLGDEWIFMDGTDASLPFGVTPYYLQGKEAMVAIDEQNFKIIKAAEGEMAMNFTTDSTLIKIQDRDISGEIKIHYTGHPAWGVNNVMKYYNESREREKAIKDMVNRGSNKFIQTSFDYKEIDDPGKDAYISSGFSIKDYIQKVDNEYYVNMNLQRDWEGSWVDVKERKVPISHQYKDRLKEVIVIDIPKGYHVSYVPPDKSNGVSDLWGYKLSYKTDDKRVVFTKDFELSTLSVLPEQFAAHNKMIEELKNYYKESIVLTPNK